MKVSTTNPTKPATKPKNDTKKFYEDACNSNTPESELLRIWNSTTSAKVRKAIASNPNVGADLLRIASRLYLDEALANPAFELLKIFTDDQWIMSITEAHEDPKKFIRSISYYNASRHGAQIKAVLASEKIDLDSLCFCLEYASTADLNRAVKNSNTRARLHNLVVRETKGIKIGSTSNYNKARASLSASGCITAMKLGIISESEALEYFRVCNELLKKFGRSANPHRVHKNSLSQVLMYVQKKFNNSSTSAQERIGVMDLVSEAISFCAHSLSTSQVATAIKSSLPYPYNQNLNGLMMEYMAELFKVLKYNLSATVSSSCLDAFPGFFFEVYSRAPKVCTMSGMDQLKGFHGFIRSLGIEKDFCQHFSTGVSVSGSDQVYVLNRLGAEVKDLEAMDMESKMFYIKAICNGNLIRLTKGTALYKIVEEVNNELYYNHGKLVSNLIYDRSNIGGTITVF